MACVGNRMEMDTEGVVLIEPLVHFLLAFLALRFGLTERETLF
jgi:hypothetical protein